MQIEVDVYRDIPGYEGLYQVSDRGNVRSVRKNRLLRLQNLKGYRSVQLSAGDGYKQWLVHRLVLLAFEGPSGLCVNHKDGCRANNVLSNLEYVTYSENNYHAYRIGHAVPHNTPKYGENCNLAKLSNADVLAIRSLSGKALQREIARQFGVTANTIWRILNGQSRMVA